MECSICGEKIESCDECGKKFHKGQIIFCDTEDFDKHKCNLCYVSAEEGEVE